MAFQQIPTSSSPIAASSEPATTQLHRYRLQAARLAWLALAFLLLGLLIAAAPRDLATLQQPCTGRICLRGQLHVSLIGPLEARGVSIQAYGALLFALQLSAAVSSIVVAAIIFWRRPDDWMALLGAFTLLVWGITASDILVVLDERSPIWLWTGYTINMLGTTLLTAFLYLFPSGRFVPHWLRWLAPAWIAAFVLLDLLPALVGGNPWVGRITSLGQLTSLVFDAWLASLAIAQIYRYRRTASPTQRQQTKWVMLGVAVGIGGPALVDATRQALWMIVPSAPPIPPFVSGIAFYALMPLVPLTFGLAILRARLYEIDTVINRTLVYSVLSTCVMGVYVLVVGYLGTLLHAEGNLAISLFATGLVAVLFQPLRERIQRGVDRLMYGDRDDPYAAISRLGQRLETTFAPDAVLPTIVQTVREALKLPYVAIAIDQAGQCITAASSGTPTPQPLVLPLTYQGELLGQLILGPRGGGESWSRADQQLLTDLARQAGTAVHAVRLTLDLQQARALLRRAVWSLARCSLAGTTPEDGSRVYVKEIS